MRIVRLFTATADCGRTSAGGKRSARLLASFHIMHCEVPHGQVDDSFA